MIAIASLLALPYCYLELDNLLRLLFSCLYLGFFYFAPAIESAFLSILFSASITALCNSSYCHNGAARSLQNSDRSRTVCYGFLDFLLSVGLERAMLLAVRLSIAALCFLLCLNNITARTGEKC